MTQIDSPAPRAALAVVDSPPRMLNHFARVTPDAEATVQFYTRVMNMQFVQAVVDDSIPSTGEAIPYFHIFFRLGSKPIAQASMQLLRVPFALSANDDRVSAGGCAQKLQRSTKRDCALQFQATAINAQFVANVDENASGIQLPEEPFKIVDSPISRLENGVSGNAQEDGANHARGFRRLLATLNQWMGIESEQHLVGPQPRQGRVLFEITQQSLGASLIAQRLQRNGSECLAGQI